jgi:hypothetical protein
MRVSTTFAEYMFYTMASFGVLLHFKGINNLAIIEDNNLKSIIFAKLIIHKQLFKKETYT